MKILLLGDYSNVHCTLADGLRTLGHECALASDGDGWKNYPRDIDLARKPGKIGLSSFLYNLGKALPRFRNYDIVQLINPVFLELKAERIVPIYNYLRQHNRKVVLGAFGMDTYWVDVNTSIRPLRYGDFNIGDMIRMDQTAELFRKEWLGTEKESLCRKIAEDCDWIVAGLQEYWATYNAVPELREKMSFIPFPINLNQNANTKITFEPLHRPVRIFVGVSKGRSEYKGTDIMLAAAKSVKKQYPDLLELVIAEGVPFQQYQKMMNDSDAILDQLYSYTPAMNSLLAMSKGIINIGGGEPENYEILGEKELRPIINVQPTFNSCRNEIEQLVLHPERIPELKRQSIEYVRRHHEHVKIAKLYEELYQSLLAK